MAISRKKLNAVSRSRDLTRRGFSREQIRRLAAKGDVERAGRGVYFTPSASRSPHRDLLIVAARAPNAVFCLPTALTFHRLTTEMPHEVWIAIGLKARMPAIDTPPIRVVRLSEAPLSAGIETHLEHGVALRVLSRKDSRDCFKVGARSASKSPCQHFATAGNRSDSPWTSSGTLRAFAASVASCALTSRCSPDEASGHEVSATTALNEAKRPGESFGDKEL